MASNLIETFRNTVGELLIKQGSSILGESAEGIQTAMDTAVPALFGALTRKGNSENGAREIVQWLNEQQLDSTILSQAPALLNGGIETEKLMYQGAGLLRLLFNEKLLPVVDLISGSSGLKTSSATSLLKMAAPFVMGVIAKEFIGKTIDASSLSALLASQQDRVNTIMPAALSGLVGQETITPTSQNASNSTSGSSTETGMFSLSRMLPWIILGITALGLFYFVQKGCGGSSAPPAEPMTAPDTVGAKSSVPPEEYVTFELPGGDHIFVRQGSFSGKLATFLANNAKGETCLPFDKVRFENGSFKLTSGSEIQLGELAKMMQAYSKITISIEAHTDNAGNENNNKDLSRDQAKTIKDWLTEHEIAPGRISTKGLGSSKPIDTNETAAGRENNRRVEVCVTKK